MFTPLKDILPKSVKASPAQKQLHASVVTSAARKALEERFGAGESDRMHIVSFKAGTLKIVCDAAPYAQEIRLCESEIVRAVNERLGTEDVARIMATAG